MCFEAESALYAALPFATYRRWYQDSAVLLKTSASSVVSTPGQPILTHRGWVAASAIQVGDYVVETRPQPSVVSIRDLWELPRWRGEEESWVSVQPPAQGFWGDAGVATQAQVAGSLKLGGPLQATEASSPSVDRGLLWSILARLSHPEAFGVASWAQAVARVPDLGRVWPGGQPTNRGAGISAVARARLGSAVLELPEPPEDRYPEWVVSLLGWSVSLNLTRVEATQRSVLRGWVFNYGCLQGAFVADGVVVGSTS